MAYAIETINLVKRYPTNAVRIGRGGFGGERGVPTSFGGILRVLRGGNGPFVEALRGVDLKIKEGEIFGILGPNGAGKTTLIKILCTLVIHDEGEAYVHGFDVKKEPSKVLRNLQAVLPESRGFAWRLSGLQNLEFYALLYGLGKKQAEERISYLLKLTGLKERAYDGFQRYSTGMQRKLLLCRALLRNTPVLLFDEPTAGLDPISAVEFRDMLQRLTRDEGKTIFLSTHNLNEAQSICDRIAILDSGKIIACNTPDSIRYMTFAEEVFSITFIDALFDDDKEKMVNELKKISGVQDAILEVDSGNHFHGMSIRADKNIDLSDILEVIIQSRLKIKMINTKEPTLEEAFMAITGWKQDR